MSDLSPQNAKFVKRVRIDLAPGGTNSVGFESAFERWGRFFSRARHISFIQINIDEHDSMSDQSTKTFNLIKEINSIKSLQNVEMVLQEPALASSPILSGSEELRFISSILSILSMKIITLTTHRPISCSLLNSWVSVLPNLQELHLHDSCPSYTDDRLSQKNLSMLLSVQNLTCFEQSHRILPNIKSKTINHLILGPEVLSFETWKAVRETLPNLHNLEIEQRLLPPYRTLQKWTIDPVKFDKLRMLKLHGRVVYFPKELIPSIVTINRDIRDISIIGNWRDTDILSISTNCGKLQSFEFQRDSLGRGAGHYLTHETISALSKCSQLAHLKFDESVLPFSVVAMKSLSMNCRWLNSITLEMDFLSTIFGCSSHLEERFLDEQIILFWRDCAGVQLPKDEESWKRPLCVLDLSKVRERLRI
ncbi:hypothetical protein NEOLI_000489 [Neolecta irregularis DAH-3]|uniref:F-box protein n=1 Tax=Neolecta irregularis (strain DAH-3) TaxID=1198029 RepID=A0A1U7LU63_NEOID|nr:hypothetical protein NEOLI_000489 [Neolecta irregularis DAH-3]|eukprot:OLL26082.1 hypothetical protein NEOLI_000489 [Neolecta irregularis DAH-3]